MTSKANWPSYENLPAVKQMPDCTVDRYGKQIASPEQWNEQRAYLKGVFTHYMYGEAPKDRGLVTAEVAEKTLKFDGKAVEEQITLSFGKAKTIPLRVRFVYPNETGKRFPLIVKANDNAERLLPLEEKAVTEYGYALAAFDYRDLSGDRTMLEAIAQYRAGTMDTSDPIVLEIIKNRESTYPKELDFEHIHHVASAYPGYDWGKVAQWGFGYLLCMDYFETLPQIDLEKVCYTGHSRLGKSALWAGIYDERAAVVTPNGSGCGGVGSFRFLGGHADIRQDPAICETIGGITNYAPEWWCDEFKNFGDVSAFPKREEYLPFDANTLRAAVAPRACFTTEAISDDWSNPCGTQFAWEDAQPLFDLLGISQKNGIHFREGGHAHNEEDWQALFTYCNFLWFGKTLTEDINQKRFER